MKELISTMETVLSAINRGMVHVTEDMEVILYTKVAKAVSGVILKTDKRHEAGVIQQGDIVIITDNELENDDFLTPGDFRLINIHDEEIKKGDAVIAIGVYKNKDAEPIYKFERTMNPSGIFRLKTEYHGVYIDAEIDYENRKHKVTVDDEAYEMGYYDATGFMVIVDGRNGNVKFFQAQGCGVRDEETGKILRGKRWLPKIGKEESGELIDLENLNMEKVFAEKEIIGRIKTLMKYDNGYSEKGLYMIYNKPAFCEFIRIKNGSMYDGVNVIIQDVLNLEEIRNEKIELIGLLEERQRKRLEAGYKHFYAGENQFINIVGKSNTMQERKSLAYKASKGNFNVLITGESGTGKSMLAREIHKRWNENAPFVEVNCNAIASSLFESELFGYEAGAFTGANPKGKKGFFEEANGGTLFLDEIGDLSADIQVKLLQAIEDKKIYRVGSTKPIDINVRIITATNSDLLKEVKKGNFRKDLYYRINVFPIVIPPIRERKDDLYLLANSLLENICSHHKIDTKLLSDEAFKKMEAYTWPGNVRELENVLERAVVLCDSTIIYSENIILEQDEMIGSFKEQMLKAEREIIRESFIRNKGDKRKMVAELNISQASLYDKIKKYGVEKEQGTF